MYKFFRFSVTTAHRISISNGIDNSSFGCNSYCYGATPYASNTNLNYTETAIPSAESIYQSESMKLPSSIESFIILIANEAHES